MNTLYRLIPALPDKPMPEGELVVTVHTVHEMRTATLTPVPPIDETTEREAFDRYYKCAIGDPNYFKMSHAMKCFDAWQARAALPVPARPVVLTYGDGRIETQPGKIDGVHCIALKDTGIARPVGATDRETSPPIPQEYYDVILLFKNLESARLLQDIVNEVVCQWARESSPDANPKIHTNES